MYKENKLDIIYKEYIDDSFHDSLVLNMDINNNKFTLRMISSSYFLADEIKISDNKLRKIINDKGYFIIDLVITKPNNIDFYKLFNGKDLSELEVISIEPIYKKDKIDGFKFILLDDIENINFKIYGEDFYYNLITYVSEINKRIDFSFFESIRKKYTNI